MKNHISESINPTRAEILNLLEGIVPQEKWAFVRSRVLTALGKNGLEGRLQRLLADNQP